MVNEQVDLPTDVMTCPKCNEPNRPGLFRCEKCHASLRPQFLMVLTLGRVILGTWQVVSSVWMMLQCTVSVDPYIMFRLFMSSAGVVISVSLYYGRYWAWMAIQVLIVVNVLSFIARLLLGDLNLRGKPISPIVCIIYFCLAALVFWYFYTKKVRLFCSVGRGRSAVNVS